MTQANTHTATSAYASEGTRRRIEEALTRAGEDPDHLVLDDLALLEDFHSLGRIATLGLIQLAAVSSDDRVLDAGSGIGGTARLVAAQAGSRVTAVDLTPDYCETARWLNHAVGLDDRIDVLHGDVLDLPFADASFDVVISQHVQMNVADKPRLYAEARRVLAPGGRLALWDVTAGPEQPIHFPVPWATTAEHSHLIAPGDLRELLEDTGFEVTAWTDLTDAAGDAMERFFASPPAQLGLHVYVPDFAAKAANLIANGRENRTRLIQAVLTVPA
jgi:ubiquinone/menaquinone biosynthesis C-methylase UbiE